MGIPVEAFPASQLLPPHNKLQTTASGRRRKEEIDLTQCQLQELIQYECSVRQDKVGKVTERICCKDVRRLFRRCQNGLTVETTALEPLDERLSKPTK